MCMDSRGWWKRQGQFRPIYIRRRYQQISLCNAAQSISMNKRIIVICDFIDNDIRCDKKVSMESRKKLLARIHLNSDH